MELKQEKKTTTEAHETLMWTISHTHSAEDAKYSHCSIHTKMKMETSEWSTVDG